MRTLVLEAIVKTAQPVSHNGGEKAGNMGLFRTEDKWYRDEKGRFKSFSCPVISANSLRHQLREASSKIFLDGLGDDEKTPLKVKLQLHSMLFSGGGQVTSSKKDLTGDVGHFMEIRENITPLALWGASKGNSMMPGLVDVTSMHPIGRETIGLLPESLQEKATGVEVANIQGIFAPNTSETAKEIINKLLPLLIENGEALFFDKLTELCEPLAGADIESVSSVASAILEDYKKGVASKSVAEYMQNIFNTTKDQKNNPEVEKYLEIAEGEVRESIQMLYYTQVMSAGVPMYWRIVLRDVNDAEYGLFIAALMRFQQVGSLGGKRSNGMGRFEFVEMQWTDVTKVGDTLTIEGKETHDIYAEFLAERKEATKDFLKSM